LLTPPHKKFADVSATLNLIEVDELIDNFIKEHQPGIATVHRLHYHTDNQLSFYSLLVELKEPLRTGCITFINKQYPIQEINSYLFYIVNDYCKKNSVSIVKAKKEYVCPGCLYLGEINLIELKYNSFQCDLCSEKLTTNDPKKEVFFKTFATHNKNGWKCQDCKKFIPQPFDNSTVISCPYYDCCFVGELASLKKMQHPTSKTNPEKPILKELVSEEVSVEQKLIIKQTFQNKITRLKEVIDQQKNNISYISHDYTIPHKLAIYQAFSNLIDEYPEDFTNYLLNNSRSGGFQHKIFQEYIKLLEEKLPFKFRKGKQEYKIETLLDENLSLFEGISIFESVITDKLTIKNETNEFYIGGRKSQIAQPYYIGKLLNIVNGRTKETLIDKVVEYSFSLIKLQDVQPKTPVIITHLRIPPHYQMGGMANINRIRKKIIEKFSKV
jgi:hypothetical protein